MCIAGHLRRVTLLFRGSGETRHDKARHNKSKETHQQPLPMAARDKIEAGQGDARSQQEAAKEPKRRLFGRKALANRPDRKSTRLNSSHLGISYAVFCLKKKKQ